jgi:hypothetical protein
MRGDSKERLTILSETEKTALYDIPDFDDFQRIEFFAMTEAERSLALQRRGLLNPGEATHLPQQPDRFALAATPQRPSIENSSTLG